MSAAKLEQVYIIWACLPRQQAYEVGLEENLPYSEFLKIICLTLKELLMNKPQSPSYFLERAVHWMSVAVRVHRGFICERAKCPDPWLTCLCVTCYAGGLCEHSTHSPDDKRPIQTPAGWFSESKSDIEMNGIISIIEPIAEPIMKLGENILNNKHYCKHIAEGQARSNHRSHQVAGPSSVRRGVGAAQASAPALPQPHHE
ncbi:hypothetical protein FRC12_000823 [Ceratobasidium sp. 428]|nr:hypothetical protein FRC12_000823 [Ceratobasidium sp. 428]